MYKNTTDQIGVIRYQSKWSLNVTSQNGAAMSPL